jgi:hypothetical protein
MFIFPLHDRLLLSFVSTDGLPSANVLFPYARGQVKHKRAPYV